MMGRNSLASLHRGLCVAACLPGTLMSSSPLHAQPATSSATPINISEHYASLFSLFRQEGLLPVLVNRGQQVGWVFDTESLRYIDKGGCFPKLPVPAPQPQISKILTLNSKGADINASLGLAKNSISGELSQTRVVKVDFTEIEVVFVTDKELRKAFNKKECPELSPAIENSASKTSQPNRYLIVGEIWFAKPRVLVQGQTAAGANGGAGISPMGLQKFGLKLSAAASASAVQGNSFAIESDVKVPIAVRPAFLQERRGILMGPQSSASDQEYRAYPFKPEIRPSQQAVFDSLVDDISRRVRDSKFTAE